jgi:hypothetical protein
LKRRQGYAPPTLLHRWFNIEQVSPSAYAEFKHPAASTNQQRFLLFPSGCEQVDFDLHTFRELILETVPTGSQLKNAGCLRAAPIKIDWINCAFPLNTVVLIEFKAFCQGAVIAGDLPADDKGHHADQRQCGKDYKESIHEDFAAVSPKRSALETIARSGSGLMAVS